MTNVTLVIPFGGHDTPIAHGSIDYQPNAYRADITDPNSPWLVDVPAHVAEHLCHNAGFYQMPQESEPSFTGTARLYAPHGCSWNGVQYEPDADDIVVVPSAAVADLLAFPPICPEALRPEQGAYPAENDRAEFTQQLTVTQSALEAATTLLGKRDKEIAELQGRLHAADPSAFVDEPAAKPAKPSKA